MPFEFRSHPDIPDVVMVTPRMFRDERGWFMESFRQSDFRNHGIPSSFVQDSQAFNGRRGIVRGLHYQLEPHGQGKLVRCTRGTVFDVAVDLRQGSPTFARWVGETLSGEDRRMLWIPAGFAHGYATLTDESELDYKLTAEYAPTAERTIRWDDPAIAIRWPVREPLLHPKDDGAPGIHGAELNFKYVPHGSSPMTPP